MVARDQFESAPGVVGQGEHVVRLEATEALLLAGQEPGGLRAARPYVSSVPSRSAAAVVARRRPATPACTRRAGRSGRRSSRTAARGACVRRPRASARRARAIAEERRLCRRAVSRQQRLRGRACLRRCRCRRCRCRARAARSCRSRRTAARRRAPVHSLSSFRSDVGERLAAAAVVRAVQVRDTA